MIDQSAASQYAQQLHPAFAGYLHDGTISERDVIATIIHLCRNGTLIPGWSDGAMTGTLEKITKTSKTPDHTFEGKIINTIFADAFEVPTSYVGKLIKDQRIQKVIHENLEVMRTFSIINKTLTFSLGKETKVTFKVNGKKVESIADAAQFRTVFYKRIVPLFLSIDLLFFIKIALFPSGENDASPLLMFIFMSTAIIGLIGVIFHFSQKRVTYDFVNDVVPVAQQKYQELYEFLRANPLPSHRFTNELLPFAIAFGLDTSWHRDFNLEADVPIDASPVAT